MTGLCPSSTLPDLEASSWALPFFLCPEARSLLLDRLYEAATTEEPASAAPSRLAKLLSITARGAGVGCNCSTAQGGRAQTETKWE